MESKEPNIEEIESYLTGQMSAADAGLFEARLGNDEALREQTETLRTAIEVAKQYRAHELKLYIEKHAPKIYKNTFWQTTIIYSVAASLVLLSVSYGLLIYFDKDQKQMAQDIELEQGSKYDSPRHYNKKEELQKNENGAKVAEEEMPMLDHKLGYATDSVLLFENKDKLAGMPVDKEYSGESMTEDIPSTAATADNFKVQTDELVLDTNFIMYLAMEVVNTEKKALKRKSIILPQQNNNSRNNQSAPSRQNDNNESDKTIEYRPQMMLNVEFWKSPVNYKGYRYNTKKLIIYGMKATDITLIKVKGVLYIKSAGQYYKIEENDSFNNFWAESVSPVED